MALTKTDTADSQFRVRVAVAGVRRFVLTLLSAFLVGCGGDGDSGADTAAPQASPLQEQILVFTQAGPLNLVVGDTLSNVASGGLGTGVIRYSSSDTTIATVDATGRLTVVGAGIAMITAEAADTQYKAAASADYDVSATPVPHDPGPEPQRIGFDQPGPFNLVVGDTLSNVASGGSGTGVIRYSSSNTTVATVDATGQLTVVGAGIAMITAEKAADANYTAASASYLVQTTQASQAIGFDQPGPLYLMVGDTLRNVASGGSGTGVISYSSSNTTVATVDAAGELTVVGIGTAEITAEKAADAQYTAASASYTVSAPSRVSVTAWVGRADAKVDLPLWASDMLFFRSSEANCDLFNVANCANGQWNIVAGGQTVTDTAFTLNQPAYYVLQHGANQASLTVSAKHFRERNNHQVVTYNDRLWLIGGRHGRSSFKNDVWWSEDGVTWTEVPPEARGSEHFSPRDRHRVVVHNDRLWLIGGRDGTDYYDDVWWSQDGAIWTEARGSEHFSPRANHQVVVHNDRLLLIGGWDGTDSYDDVWWSQDGVTWNEATGSADFSPRSTHQVVAHNDRLWLIGGWDGTDYYDDVWWSEDGVTWSEATGSADFSPRGDHQVVAHNNRLWLIGGWDDANINDVWWSQDGVNWEEVARTGPRFSGRSNHQAVAHNNRLWLIGGWDDTNENDVWWSDDGVTWTEATSGANLPPREAHQVVTYNNRLWVIGGDDGRYTNDVWWSEDGLNWELTNNSTPRFSARVAHQVVVHNDELWVIGGWDDEVKDDVWRSKDGVTWTKVEKEPNSKKFTARSGHQVVAHNDWLWVIGGWNNASGLNNDVWRSRDGKNWTEVAQTTDIKEERFRKANTHQVVAHNNRLWVIGGGNNEVWWSENGADWTKVEPTDNSAEKRFSPRNSHQVVAHNNRLWVIGGEHGAKFKNDVWWSEDGADWTEATNNAGFSPRKDHQAVVHNDGLWMIGGWDGSQKNDVWRSEDGVNWRLGFQHVFQFQ